MEDKELEARLIYALTVDERRQSLLSCTSHKDNILLWRSITGRLSEVQFEEKLRIMGYTRSQYNNVIQNLEEIEDPHVIESLKQQVRESFWYHEIHAILTYWESTEYDLLKRPLRSDIALVNTIFVEWASHILSEKAKTLTQIIVDAGVIALIRQNFYNELMNVVIKTIVYEFNDRKADHAGRYTINNFIDECFGTCGDVIEFYLQYPVLLRRVVTKTRYLMDALINIFVNVDANFADIQQAIPALTSNKLTAVEWGVGDTHAKSTTVCVLSFGEFKVVYKPHNNDTQELYNRFLRWINMNSDLLPFYTTTDYYAKSFSVCQFIEQVPCTSTEEIDRFYVRMGQNLAVLFLLTGMDMHSENIIALGEHPVIIDHETLFNNLSFKGARDSRETVYGRMTHRVWESLINSGVLPMEVRGIDFGALVRRDPRKGVKRWALTYQDDETISFEFRDIYVPEDNNIPKLDDVPMEYMDYAAQIITGYNQTYLFFRDHKEQIWDLIQMFSEVKVRIILSATMHYAELYSYTSHPNYMVDMLMLDKLFENIWAGNGRDMVFYLHELKDAHNCDIPIFHTYPNSTSLFASDGIEMKDFFDRTSMACVEERMGNMDTEFGFEVAILKKALGTDNADESAYWATCTQRIDHAQVLAPFGVDEVIARINNEIEKRLMIVNDSVSWYELADGVLLTFANTDLNELSGLGLYLEQCKKAGILLSDGLEKALEAIGSMVLSRRFLTSLDVLSSTAGTMSCLGFLLHKYLDTRNFKYWEQIERRLEHLNTLVKEDFLEQLELNAELHVPSMIILLSRLYQIRPAFMTLNLLKKLGHFLIKQMYRFGLSDGGVGEKLVASALLTRVFPEQKDFASLYDFISSFVMMPTAWIESKFEQGDLNIGLEDGALQRLGSYLITAAKISGDNRYETCLIYILDCIDGRTPPLTDMLSTGVCADLNFLMDLYAYVPRRGLTQDETEREAVTDREDQCAQMIHSRVQYLAYGYSVNGSLRVKGAGVLPRLGLLDGTMGVGYSLLRSLDPGLESPLNLT
jgi:type 2 lantibiotic biosynthesis protein LanM